MLWFKILLGLPQHYDHLIFDCPTAIDAYRRQRRYGGFRDAFQFAHANTEAALASNHTLPSSALGPKCPFRVPKLRLEFDSVHLRILRIYGVSLRRRSAECEILTNEKRKSFERIKHLIIWNSHTIFFENNDSGRLGELVVGFEVEQKVPSQFAPPLAADCFK